MATCTIYMAIICVCCHVDNVYVAMYTIAIKQKGAGLNPAGVVLNPFPAGPVFPVYLDNLAFPATG